MYRCPRIYLAAPFFNPAQVQLVQAIETTMVDSDVPFFSPRLQSGNKKPQLTPEVAHEIKAVNKAQIICADIVLAVVDWKMPELQSVRIIQQPEDKQLREDGYDDIAIGGPLNIPDAGVCWEMGFAEDRRPIIIFTERPREAGLNLMLTQGCMGVIYGLDNFRNYCWALGRERNQDAARATLHKWEGKNI